MKKIVQALLLALIVIDVSAQDPHFSQFYFAPLYLNPALTGAFDGNYRLSGLFRSQWGSVLQNESVPMYRTYTASADFRTDKAISRGDAFGFGLSFLGDQAGEAKFGYNVGGLSIAYHKSLNRLNTNYLALGFSSQIYEQTIDYSNLQFGSQWDGSGYNPLLPTNEFLVDNKKLYWDINAGLLWYMQLGRKKRTDVYLGFSTFHINRPAISMLGDDNVRLNMKFCGTGGATLPLNNRFFLEPKFILLFQGQSEEMMLAADVKMLFDERDTHGSNFHIGAMFRMVGGDPNAPWKDNVLDPESVVLDAGVEWNSLNLGVAYDINVSSLLQASQSRGGFEVGLTYIGRWKHSKNNHIYCPHF